MTETCGPQGAETVTLDCDLAPLISSLTRLIDQRIPPVPEPLTAAQQAEATLAALALSTRTPLEQYNAERQALLEIKPFATELEEMEVWQRAFDNLEPPLTEFDERMREVTSSASEALGVFVRTVYADTESVAEAFDVMVASITESLLETFIFQPLASGLEGLLGNALDEIIDVGGSLLDGIFDGGWLKGYATGTSNASAGLAVVGEAGPELINFRGGESVTPLSSAMAGLGGGGDVIVNVINETGVNARAETQQNENGSVDVRLLADEMVATGLTGRRSMEVARAAFGTQQRLKDR